MGKIIVLDELTVNKIAAGEVIERPASVIKELVENSIDAGASQITIEVRRGGKTYIKVSDNGCGIPGDDVLMAFEKHATSKIRSGDDLDSIMTLGFRGEALASIAAVSKVEMITRTADESYGNKVVIQGGTMVESSKCGCPRGTTFIIRELFFNTPARFKFLKKDATEASHIIDTVERIALARPDISFRLINSGMEVLRTPGDGDLKNAVFSIYGKDIVRNMKEIDFSDGSIRVSGFAGNIETAVSGRSRQSVYINGRYIKSKVVTSAIDEAYKTLMMKGKHPFVILKLDINPHFVDVNVHPTKMEVRFSDENTIFRSVYGAISGALFKTKTVSEKYDPGNTRDEIQLVPDIADSPNTETGIKPYITVTEPDTDKIVPDDAIMAEYRQKDTKGPETLFFKEMSELKDISVSDFSSGSSGNFSGKLGVEAAEPDGSVADAPEREATTGDIDEDRLLLREAQYIGQVFNTYIILQYKDEIIFIDQHAAHERVLYEELKKNAAGGNGLSQYLLSPVAIELTRSEYEVYRNNQKLFAGMGFSIDDFGVNSILVRALPSVLNNNEVKPVIIEILRDIMNGTAKGKSLTDDEKLFDIACKAAVKANMKLDSLEVNELLRKMSGLSNPFTCPHGRPLTFRMTKKEMEKKFKRIL